MSPQCSRCRNAELWSLDDSYCPCKNYVSPFDEGGIPTNLTIDTCARTVDPKDAEIAMLKRIISELDYELSLYRKPIARKALEPQQ